MSTYLLDTSALIAHLRHEAGCTQVQALLADPEAVILLAAPSLLEMDIALKTKVTDEARRRAIAHVYAGDIADVVPVNADTAPVAMMLRNASQGRLPAMDALIAGCAAVHGAILVHRDPHFDTIPTDRLRTLRLTDTPESPSSPAHPGAVREKRARYRTKRRA